MTQPLDDSIYFYSAQIRNLVTQVMAVFANLKVRVGASETKDSRLISIPIHYGSKDKVVASIKADNTQNKPIRVPCMSVYMTRLDMAPELRKSVGQTRRNTYLSDGGVFPEDIRVVHQLMPVPYKAGLELAIFTTSTEQHFQLLEQILTLFNPFLQLQTSDDVMDWTRVTNIELMGVNFNETYPPGTERRFLLSTLDFEVPIYLTIPADVRDKFVADIMVRVAGIGGTTVTAADMAENPYDTVAKLDQEKVPPTVLFSLDDIDIEES